MARLLLFSCMEGATEPSLTNEFGAIFMNIIASNSKEAESSFSINIHECSASKDIILSRNVPIVALLSFKRALFVACLSFTA